MLTRLVDGDHLRKHLFANSTNEQQGKLSAVVDRLNHRYGRAGRSRLRSELASQTAVGKRALLDRLDRETDGSLRLETLLTIPGYAKRALTSSRSE